MTGRAQGGAGDEDELDQLTGRAPRKLIDWHNCYQPHLVLLSHSQSVA